MTPPAVSVRQIKAARALLGWSQDDLAALSGISEPTIKRVEAGIGALRGRPTTQARILAAFERAGIEFLGGEAAGVRLWPKSR